LPVFVSGAKAKRAIMINVISCTQTCTACPSQWEGVCSDGRHIYIRFRWGCLTYGLGDTIDDAVTNSLKCDGIEISDGLDGWMTNAEMQHVMLQFDIHFAEITGGDL
jgi:hypothetical protein